MSLALALVTFHGETAAASAFGRMRERAESDAPWTHEVAIVEHLRGGRVSVRGTFANRYVDVEETDHVSEPGAAEGALTGGLVGLLFGPPGLAAGLVLGGVIGAEVGKPTEVELEPEPLVEELREAVPKGDSAVVLLAEPAHVDAMLATLPERHGDVIRHLLTEAQTSALIASLSAAPPASSGA